MNYFEIEISFNENNYEALYGILYLNGFETILEENGFLRIYSPDGDKAESLKAELLKAGFEEKTIQIKKLENKNWNEEWEKSIEPVYIADKIVVYPSWKKNELENADGKILIEIDPKMSFGTGHNETTQLMLEMMAEHIDKRDKYLLDFGSGTGVLAIAGIKLGIERAVAIDIEDEAKENSAEYFSANSVEDRITFYQSDICGIEESGFDAVCANIIRSVITEKLGAVKDKMKNGGKLFLSGILTEEEDILKDALDAKNFEIKQILKKAEWLGIYAVKKQ